MATQNISRLKGRHKKRDVSVSVSEIGFDDMAVSADIYQLVAIPKNCHVVGATVEVLVANDAATSALADIGWDGGDELFTAVDLGAAGATASIAVPISVINGATLTILPTYTGTPTEGSAVVSVEYIEYEQCSGELTNFVE